jgi:hypothetical protein
LQRKSFFAARPQKKLQQWNAKSVPHPGFWREAPKMRHDDPMAENDGKKVRADALGRLPPHCITPAF